MMEYILRLLLMDKLGIVLITSALIAGAANTLGFTLQNKQPVIQNDFHKHFFHPYMQVAMRFVSNSFSLLLYFGLKMREKKVESSDSLKNNIRYSFFLFLIPTLLDYVSVICYYTALNFIDGSVYQILRGGTVLTTYLFSYTCLKVRPTRQKIYGCTIALVGLVVVGIVNFLMSTGTAQKKQETLVGYGLILIALFGNGLHFVYQQHLILKYQIKPLLIVGMEGIFGILISLIFIPIMGIIPCGLGSQICVINQSGEPVVQNAGVYFTEVINNELILAGVLIVVLSMSIYNSVGVTIAKYMNSLTRAICDVTRTVIVWMIGIVITACLAQNDKRFRWESLNGWQIFGESAGFIILIIGNLIYYQVIRLPLKQQIKRSTLIDDAQHEEIIVASSNQ